MHKNFGKVPQYIKKYNDEFAEKKAKKAQEEEDKNLPEGMKLMPEEERLATLNELLASKETINEMLQKMPISMRTQSLQEKKRGLETKLQEVERAITTFSRKKVLIAM